MRRELRPSIRGTPFEVSLNGRRAKENNSLWMSLFLTERATSRSSREWFGQAFFDKNDS